MAVKEEKEQEVQNQPPQQVQTQSSIIGKLMSDEAYMNELNAPGVVILDVYSKFAGPCEAMMICFKRLKHDFDNDLRIYQACSDGIEHLAKYRNKSIPCFLFFIKGVLTNILKGANSPALEKITNEQIQFFKSEAEPIPFKGEDFVPVMASSNHLDEPGTIPDDAPVPESKLDEEFTLALIKPDAASQVKEIKLEIKHHNFEIVREKKFVFSKSEAMEFYAEHKERPFFNALIEFITSGPITALILSKENAVLQWRALMGSANPRRAKEEEPNSIRAKFGTDNKRNAVHGSDSAESYKREASLIFSTKVRPVTAPHFERTYEEHIEQKTLLLAKVEKVEVQEDDQNTKWTTEMIVERIRHLIMIEDLEIQRHEPVTLTKQLLLDLKMNFKEEKEHFWLQGSTYGFIISGDHAVDEVAKLIGPDDFQQALETNIQCFRCQLSDKTSISPFYCSPSLDEAQKQIDLLFKKLGSTSNLASQTVHTVEPTKPVTPVNETKPIIKNVSSSNLDKKPPSRPLSGVSVKNQSSGPLKQSMANLKSSGVKGSNPNLVKTSIQNIKKSPATTSKSLLGKTQSQAKLTDKEIQKPESETNLPSEPKSQIASPEKKASSKASLNKFGSQTNSKTNLNNTTQQKTSSKSSVNVPKSTTSKTSLSSVPEKKTISKPNLTKSSTTVKKSQTIKSAQEADKTASKASLKPAS